MKIIFLLLLIFLGGFFAYSDEPSAAPFAPSRPNPFDLIEVIVRTDPAEPQKERFLGEWRLEAYNIDDDAQKTSPSYYVEGDQMGSARFGLPTHMFFEPLVIKASNPALMEGEGKTFEILVPANCYDKAIWFVGPFEDAIWNYYKRAAKMGAESWNPSQVDCNTWLSNMQLLLIADEIVDELENISVYHDFDHQSLSKAFKKHQELLVPTRPAICMAEKRHNGSNMEKGNAIYLDASIGFYELDDGNDQDKILIGQNGLVKQICGMNISQMGELYINGHWFNPKKTFVLDDARFNGLIHQERNINDASLLSKMDVSVYNVRHSNGQELGDEGYDDACSLTSMIEFKNRSDDEQDINEGSGVTFSDLFNAGADVGVYLTSSGDRIVDDEDTWAILYQDGSNKVISVELLGHRRGDFRDELRLQLNGDDLFIGLEQDFELNESEIDGETAYLSYTITAWDGSSDEGERAIRRNIANCYEASDIWLRQFIDADRFADIDPFLAAEYAVRSQCFSNSRSQQSWQSEEVGFWQINSHHGVAANVAVNAGWLSPLMDYEVYIQKFDEAVFKGPRTIIKSDDMGQLAINLPTLVEGDRVLLMSKDGCCDDYQLVLPCIPEFTGFAGAWGLPYVPHSILPLLPSLPPYEPSITPVDDPIYELPEALKDLED